MKRKHSENENCEMNSAQEGKEDNDECDMTEDTNLNEKRDSGDCGNSANNANNSIDSAEDPMRRFFPKPKYMRRRMPQYYFSKPWNEDDAAKALAVESEIMKGMKKESLIIRFPDPELSKEIIMSFHPGIENVYFEAPTRPRYCFVQLAENVNADEAVAELSKIDFGVGKLFVEKKHSKEEDEEEQGTIDPYTLYIGNLPRNVNIASLKEKFPSARRVDVGYAQRSKYTRYAFIRYTSVDDAIEAFKLNYDLLLGSRSLVVRFRKIRNRTPRENCQKRHPKIAKNETITVKKEEEKNDVTSKDEEISTENNLTSSLIETAAATVLTVESMQVKEMKNDTLKLHFPDPEVTTDVVKTFYPGIENVFFRVPCNPRYCVLQLAENFNTDEVIKELSEMEFGSGKLFAERQIAKEEILESETIDPNTNQ